ncbi:hypothetical protein ACWGB8_27515 [Kitasatospora sp. NPDC054939]
MRKARRFVTAIVLAGAAAVLAGGPLQDDVIWTRPQPVQVQDTDASGEGSTVVAKAMIDVIWT